MLSITVTTERKQDQRAGAMGRKWLTRTSYSARIIHTLTAGVYDVTLRELEARTLKVAPEVLYAAEMREENPYPGLFPIGDNEKVVRIEVGPEPGTKADTPARWDVELDGRLMPPPVEHPIPEIVYRPTLEAQDTLEDVIAGLGAMADEKGGSTGAELLRRIAQLQEVKTREDWR